MELATQSIEQAGKKATPIQVSDDVFAIDYNESLIHQVVTAHLAGARQGTHSQKTRSEKRGGGIKPWRQKGTGRARAGSIRSPIWRGGAAGLANKPRDYSQKVNKKMYRKAIRSILSELLRQERMVVVDELSIAEPKTKLLNNLLQQMELNNVLIITEGFNEKVFLAARNLINIDVVDAQGIDPVSLIGHDKVLITAAAVKQIEEALA